MDNTQLQVRRLILFETDVVDLCENESALADPLEATHFHNGEPSSIRFRSPPTFLASAFSRPHEDTHIYARPSGERFRLILWE